ncbi:MAG: alpha-amylase family glycosyl hydrolase [Candidatus Moduliflexus flocculans]|nr:alpha-amylase family glycosyl hydrolase [Candidatus Moduliflexus flocculans]
MYQIFPDRFRRSNDQTAKKGIEYHRSKGRHVYYHEKWEEKPLFSPLPGEKDYNPCDYFGGTLKGIEESLEYLQSLGVSVLYLNPVFEAASNHRYNTADYLQHRSGSGLGSGFEVAVP